MADLKPENELLDGTAEEVSSDPVEGSEEVETTSEEATIDSENSAEETVTEDVEDDEEITALIQRNPNPSTNRAGGLHSRDVVGRRLPSSLASKVDDWLLLGRGDTEKLKKVIFEDRRMTDMPVDSQITSSLVEYFTRDSDLAGLSEQLEEKRNGGSAKAREENGKIYDSAMSLVKKSKGDEVFDRPAHAIVKALTNGIDFGSDAEMLCASFNEKMKNLPKYFEKLYPEGQRFYNPETLSSQTATFLYNSLMYFSSIIRDEKKEVSIFKDGKEVKTKEVAYSPMLPLVATLVLARTLQSDYSKTTGGIKQHDALVEIENFVEPFIAAAIDCKGIKGISFPREKNHSMRALQDPAMITSIVYDSVGFVDHLLWLMDQTNNHADNLHKPTKGEHAYISESGKFLHDIALLQRLDPVAIQASDIPSDIDEGAQNALGYVTYGGFIVPVFDGIDVDPATRRQSDDEVLYLAFKTGNAEAIKAAIKNKQEVFAGKFDPETDGDKTRAADPRKIMKTAVYALMVTAETGLAQTDPILAERLVEAYGDVLIETQKMLGKDEFSNILGRQVKANAAMFDLVRDMIAEEERQLKEQELRTNDPDAQGLVDEAEEEESLDDHVQKRDAIGNVARVFGLIAGQKEGEKPVEGEKPATETDEISEVETKPEEKPEVKPEGETKPEEKPEKEPEVEPEKKLEKPEGRLKDDSGRELKPAKPKKEKDPVEEIGTSFRQQAWYAFCDGVDQQVKMSMQETMRQFQNDAEGVARRERITHLIDAKAKGVNNARDVMISTILKSGEIPQEGGKKYPTLFAYRKFSPIAVSVLEEIVAQAKAYQDTTAKTIPEISEEDGGAKKAERAKAIKAAIKDAQKNGKEAGNALALRAVAGEFDPPEQPAKPKAKNSEEATSEEGQDNSQGNSEGQAQ